MREVYLHQLKINDVFYIQKIIKRDKNGLVLFDMIKHVLKNTSNYFQFMVFNKDNNSNSTLPRNTKVYIK